jgi:hypothetical protein
MLFLVAVWKYEVWSCCGFEQHDVYTKFHENWSAGWKVNRDTHTNKK